MRLLVREGSDRHIAWLCGERRVYLPRRRVVSDLTAARILADLATGSGSADAVRPGHLERTRWEVTADRDGPRWALAIVDLPGLYTDAKRLDLARATARDVIALRLGLRRTAFDVDIHPSLAPEVARSVRRIHVLERRAELARHAASDAMHAAASDLAALGLTVRDIGGILGISYQHAARVVRG
jgi:hypothetical protein